MGGGPVPRMTKGLSMTIYEVARDFYRDVKHIRRPRHIPQLFRQIGKKNAIVREHVTTVCESPRTSPCLISLGRDGEHLAKAFLGHYKDLGFNSFVFLDNNSEDACVSHLIKEAKALDCNISIYRCNLDYKLYKHSMKNFLIASVPTGAWTFYADNDEFLVLPEGVSDIKQVLEYLEQNGYDTVQFHLLDMFSDQPLHTLPDETAWSSSDLERFYRFFDISTLKSIRVNDGAYSKHRGGVRMKHFGVTPLLTKSTFFKKTGETNLRSSHTFLTTFKSRPRKVADFSLFVKHYKFNSRYAPGLERAIQENSYYDNSRECRAIFDTLKEEPSYTLDTETTEAYQNCEQLRACDFITFSETFQAYIQSVR